MTTVKVPAASAISLALVALTQFNRVLKGLPPAHDEDRLGECMHVVQHGFFPTKMLANEDQRKECRAILTEENMRRGIGKCIERAERLADFFKYASHAQDSNDTSPVEIDLGFDDFVLLSRASEVTAEDFA